MACAGSFGAVDDGRDLALDANAASSVLVEFSLAGGAATTSEIDGIFSFRARVQLLAFQLLAALLRCRILLFRSLLAGMSSTSRRDFAPNRSARS